MSGFSFYITGKSMHFSFCIITKNESTKLDKCLSCLSVFGEDIAVLDTGSTDNSIETALKYTSNVHSCEWSDDFSAARNLCASYAQNDRIICIDSDEYLISIDKASVIAEFESNPRGIGRIMVSNNITRFGEDLVLDSAISRIYDKTIYRFFGAIHEQLVPIEPHTEVSYYNSMMKVIHDGYNGTVEERHKKSLRNIAILERELKNDPDNCYYLYQLGKSLYMNGDYEKAAVEFEKCIDKIPDERPDYLEDMYISYGYCLYNLKRYVQALCLENISKMMGSVSDYCFLMGLVYMNNALFDKAVNSFLDATKADKTYVSGTGSFLAYYNIGVIYQVMGRSEEALNYYKRCGDYPKAIQRMVEIQNGLK